MSDRLEALKALASAVINEPFVPDLELRFTAFEDGQQASLAGNAFAVAHGWKGSLTAAQTLHGLTVPDWDWEINRSGEVQLYPDRRKHPTLGMTYGFVAENVARSWLLAIISALTSIEEAKP